MRVYGKGIVVESDDLDASVVEAEAIASVFSVYALEGTSRDDWVNCEIDGVLYTVKPDNRN